LGKIWTYLLFEYLTWSVLDKKHHLNWWKCLPWTYWETFSWLNHSVRIHQVSIQVLSVVISVKGHLFSRDTQLLQWTLWSSRPKRPTPHIRRVSSTFQSEARARKWVLDLAEGRCWVRRRRISAFAWCICEEGSKYWTSQNIFIN
jgi:hypothetical protein